ncbi:hypothetical protein Bpfe_020952 [Biomphalaria pfeifferi]|uniref:Uncharacterized protein n=1 Tax=Biomphalaria pfeifferi TaxID=112525 RepID=A0AAD8F355_BIOPF|nr:hypothetical protein Bpfe_020952 [Biomphalaria pfeifferi]
MTHFAVFCICGIMFIGTTLAATMESMMDMPTKADAMPAQESMEGVTKSPMGMTQGPMMMTTKKGGASTLVVSWTLSILCLLCTLFHGRRLLSS